MTLIITFNNLQGYDNLNIRVDAGTLVYELNRIIAVQYNLSADQIDIVTITINENLSLSVIPPNSRLPSENEILSIKYYYFIKPRQMISPIVAPTRTQTLPPLRSIKGLTSPSRRREKGKEKVLPSTPIRPIAPIKQIQSITPIRSIAPIRPTRRTALPPSLNRDIWQDPILIGKLQQITSSLKEKRLNLVIYYHSDQEKEYIKELLGPTMAEVEGIGPSVEYQDRNVESREYEVDFVGFNIPVAIWLIRSPTDGSIDPIESDPDLSRDFGNILKISLIPQRGAIQLLPLDYEFRQEEFYDEETQSYFEESVSNIFTSIIWLLINPQYFNRNKS